jgi:hypothetical protein
MLVFIMVSVFYMLCSRLETTSLVLDNIISKSKTLTLESLKDNKHVMECYQ